MAVAAWMTSWEEGVKSRNNKDEDKGEEEAKISVDDEPSPRNIYSASHGMNGASLPALWVEGSG